VTFPDDSLVWRLDNHLRARWRCLLRRRITAPDSYWTVQVNRTPGQWIAGVRLEPDCTELRVSAHLPGVEAVVTRSLR
jgi:hypothetical protein